MKLFSMKFRVVLSFFFFFILAFTYNAEAAKKIDATSIENYIKSTTKIYEGMSKKEAEKFMISTNTLMFWKALRGGVVANGGTLKDLDERLKSDESFYDLIKSTLSLVANAVSTLFSNVDFDETTMQDAMNDIEAGFIKLKATDKVKYEITLKAIKTLNGKTVKEVNKEADVILKKFDVETK